MGRIRLGSEFEMIAIHTRQYSCRRGWGLLQMIGGIFAGSLVLGVCVPLFMAAQRHADRSAALARLTLQAREASSHFREDVRQASSTEIAEGGRLLRLVSTNRARTEVVYQATVNGLVREVRSGPAGPVTERSLYDRGEAGCRFGREGDRVTARLEFVRVLDGRQLRYHLDCDATPRSSL